MAKITHKSLFQLVDELIDNKIVYPTTDTWKTQLSKSQVLSDVSFTTKGVVLDTADTTNALLQLISDTIPPRIKSGLNVVATDPISGSITVKAGVGFVGGRTYRVNLDKTIEVPFDSTTYIFYVTLWTDGVQIERAENPTKLTLAKIVIPEPGTTNRVKDRKDDNYEWDAYIVQYQEYKLYGDQYGNLEEDSIEFLRETVGDILGDNIIGNITINENLKIVNVSGSIKLDSNSLKIYDTSSNELAKFNSNGTFFYNTSGIEMARFTKDDARIGNILVTKNSIETGNFISGSTGFRIQDTGNAEFNDVTVRGTIYATAGEIAGWNITGDRIYGDGSIYLELDNANQRIQTSDYVSGALGSGWRVDSTLAEFQNIRARGKFSASVFEKNSISAVGGNLLVFNSDILDEDMTTTGNSLTIIGDSNFFVNDILRIRGVVDDEWMYIVDAGSAPTYTVSRDLAGNYQSGVDLPAWTKGTAVVNYGQTGDGGVLITSSEASSPYIDFFTHGGSPFIENGISVKARIGRLDGIAGASGWGIWGGEGYLGALQVMDTINIAATGSIRSNLTNSYPYLDFSNSGLEIKDIDAGGTYSTAVYGTDKYGYGALIWIMNETLKIPWAELKEPKNGSSEGMPSFRLFNRPDDPDGTAETGDLANVLGLLHQCTTAGSPGTWSAFYCEGEESNDFVLDNRTSDPGSPVAGQMWFRTDV